MKIIRQLGCNTLVRGVLVRSCFIDSVHIRKLLQCLQIADSLAIPVNPRFAAFLRLFIPMVVGVMLVKSLDLRGSSVERHVDVCERK